MAEGRPLFLGKNIHTGKMSQIWTMKKKANCRRRSRQRNREMPPLPPSEQLKEMSLKLSSQGKLKPDPLVMGTNLAQHCASNDALRNLGSNADDKGQDVQIEISKNGKKCTISHLEKQYQEWILQMHEPYDKEIESGEDFASKRSIMEKRSENIKILKEAAAGFHKNNVYATIEYFLIEGMHGDAGGFRDLRAPWSLALLLRTEKPPSLPLSEQLKEMSLKERRRIASENDEACRRIKDKET
ncbi:Structural maintenance of chromosomes flexible hinge domain-containing protein GMI1 [Linum grandiflorum]